MPTFLERMDQYLLQNHPGGAGTAFTLTHENELPEGWLAQTPDIWGKSVQGVNEGENGQRIVEHVRDLIAGANSAVDVTTLAPFPDGAFFDGIQQGLVALAERDTSEVVVRILAGYDPHILSSQLDFLNELVKPLKPIKKRRLRIYVAAQRTSIKAWNHAKIVAVDGDRALIGGQNLWTKDYLGSAPVHDLNVRLQGVAVFNMHQFVNEIWREVCGYWLENWKPAYWATGHGEAVTGSCVTDIISDRRLMPRPGRRDKKVMGVGRYGPLKGDKANPTDAAFVWAIDQAKRQVCLSQQDLLGPAGLKVWQPGVDAITRAIRRQCHVYIVVSNHGSFPYSNTWGDSPKATYRAIDLSTGSLMKDYLHVASLRFGPSDKWKGGKKFANHAKFLMIDDEAFYVGSCNFYPSDLIEFGVFLEDKGAIDHMKKRYWNPLWQYSQSTLFKP